MMIVLKLNLKNTESKVKSLRSLRQPKNTKFRAFHHKCLQISLIHSIPNTRQDAAGAMRDVLQDRAVVDLGVVEVT